MAVNSETGKVRSLRGGINQSGLRDLNERLLLSMIQRYGEMPRSELARLSGLSQQTASVITRKLEQDGLLRSGMPTKGKVGKPSTPMALAPDGVFSVGLKIGRRSAELILLDFLGTVRSLKQLRYPYPTPGEIFPFLENGLEKLIQSLSLRDRTRVIGLGVAAPHEIWNWNELVGASTEDFQLWKNIDFKAEISRFSPLPISLVNDATAACRAEHVFGRGKEFRDYAYFFVGAFVGGGVVINHSVYEGHQGNAGAFGALRTLDSAQNERSLIDTASIFLLEREMIARGKDPDQLWREPQDWSALSEILETWAQQVGEQLARAALSICAVIDFEAVLIDGAFPPFVRRKITTFAQQHLKTLDVRGLIAPLIEEGTIGEKARSVGAASGPIFDSFFLGSNTGMAQP